MEEMWMMHHFGEYEGSNSPAFVAMFPNKGGEDIKDFRPICILGGAYKLRPRVITIRHIKVWWGIWLWTMSSKVNALSEERCMPQGVCPFTILF